MRARKLLAVAILVVSGSALKVSGQIPVELFCGHKRTTADVMFFRFIPNKDGQPSRWLFFNRNRSSIDYRMNSDEFLPQFGFTEAISWNHPRLKGFAPVANVQLLNAGVIPKAGVQFAGKSQRYTVFTWLVYTIDKSQRVDHFILIRFLLALNTRLELYEQYESILSLDFDTPEEQIWTQRLRSGVSCNQWQLGLGSDIVLSGSGMSNRFYNSGLFLRHDF
jgi:hypothetical protein